METDQDSSYACPRCDAIFGTESDLEDHLQSHVTNPVGAEFICTVCGAAFEREAELNAHGVRHMTGRAA